MKQGTIKFFNQSKGYGFVVDKSTNQEVFVHVTGLIDQIQNGDEVVFETKQGKKGLMAGQRQTQRLTAAPLSTCGRLIRTRVNTRCGVKSGRAKLYLIFSSHFVERQSNRLSAGANQMRYVLLGKALLNQSAKPTVSYRVLKRNPE